MSCHTPVVGHTQDIEEDPEDEEEDRETGRGILEEEEEEEGAEDEDEVEEDLMEGIDRSNEIFEDVSCQCCVCAIYIYYRYYFNKQAVVRSYCHEYVVHVSFDILHVTSVSWQHVC